MEKRLFTAFLVTLLFLAVWSRFSPKPEPEPQTQPTQQQAVADVGAAKSDILSVTVKDLPRVEIGDFIITYSTTGGYIKQLTPAADNSSLPFEDIGFLPADKDTKYLASIEGNALIFKGPNRERKEYIFKDHSLEIKFSQKPSTPLLVFSNHLRPSMIDQRYQEVFYSQEKVVKRNGAKKVKTAARAQIDFAGARDRYYCISLLKGQYDMEWLREGGTTYIYMTSPPPQIVLYLGPQADKYLKAYDLQGVVHYGFFHAISVVMIKILYFFFGLTKSWGLSIICFAVLVYFILFPFTAKSSKAMRKMQEVQPEIEAIKAKHKDSPQKLQKETLELYRKYKINPIGGCLPLFFQFPVFIALYQVLFRFVELKGAGFLWIKDLTLPDHLFKLPFSGPIGYLNLLPILIMIVGLIQQKVTVSSSASAQQKKMGLFFGVFIGVIFYNFPSALVLYWFVQNLLTLAYQLKLSREKQTAIATIIE